MSSIGHGQTSGLLALSDAQVEQFIQEGFVRIDQAFPPELAEEARDIMWRDLRCEPCNRATWTRPVIRLPGYGEEPFRKAANGPLLHAAFDQLVGRGRWIPRNGLGTFPVRFPHPDDPGDTGWHIDVSFGLENSDFMEWRANISSKGRALLMLFLFSDVGELDAPTRIRIGSHHDVARRLALAGDAGLSLRDLAATGFEESAHLPEALATGDTGTVYLCHPFLVHAAQPHRGSTPRFIAQPPLSLAEPYQLHREDGAYSPVEIAIRRALRQSSGM
jgi:hypothetical protein